MTSDASYLFQQIAHTTQRTLAWNLAWRTDDPVVFYKSQEEAAISSQKMHFIVKVHLESALCLLHGYQMKGDFILTLMMEGGLSFKSRQ